jgi:hypothetical protein
MGSEESSSTGGVPSGANEGGRPHSATRTGVSQVTRHLTPPKFVPSMTDVCRHGFYVVDSHVTFVCAGCRQSFILQTGGDEQCPTMWDAGNQAAIPEDCPHCGCEWFTDGDLCPSYELFS